jgi:hypothetical protein
VFYIDRSTVNVDYHADREKSKMDPQELAKLGATFRNNIFFATGQGRFRRGGSVFRRNCYFGPWINGLPQDPEQLVGDPLFIVPGAGGMEFGTLGGYHLRDQSPCIDAGSFIEMDSKRDFYGNPVIDGKPDIGAYERPTRRR